MDVFLLPSRYEGFGIVFIEAQANGLITFSSDNVPQSVKTTDLISFIKLEYGPELWKQEIIKRLQNKNYSRDDKTFVNKIIAEGYDVRNSKFDLVNIYNSEREGEKC